MLDLKSSKLWSYQDAKLFLTSFFKYDFDVCTCSEFMGVLLSVVGVFLAN